ncbi:glycosyltransferase family 2 protein [Lawsonibacter sp. JLR.KK007]|uniref:glycosyltransferase family 2 protein n=1 Tax=Lawsonibacter sp. JLR.KK007 TaxID=3114293 RepID=UPI002FF232EA
MDWLFPAALALTGTFGVLMGLWGLWYLAAGLACVRKPADYGFHPPRTRFAVLIAARNEELVIGSLINSLLTQDYPAELYDIWVLPNNCTDNTARAAEQFGAKVLECTVPVKSKGEVLHFAYNRLRGRQYDAWLVFDADNVVDRSFLAEMNNARLAGAQAAQGYRDSKNPYDTAVSGCSSIYYWMMDRFHNGGKAGLGASAMIGGTGFMVTQRLLDKLGGWHTETISEDLEITAQAVLAGEKVAYVPKAVTYDEQPLTWEQSMKQRRRWTSGTLQVAQRFLPLLGEAQSRRPRLTLLDFEFTLLMPAYQLAALAGLAGAALTSALGGRTVLQSLILALVGIFGNLAWAALTATAAAGIVLTLEGKWDRRLWKGLAAYWLFLLTWLPITAASFWKKTTVWEEIRHTRAMVPQLPER